MKTIQVSSVNRSLGAIVLAATIALFSFQAVQAEVTLRYSPADTTVGLDDTANLVIEIDEAMALRSIEVTVDYDPGILTSLGGSAGQLFTSTGSFIFEDFEEDSPGQWHGFAVVMDAGNWVVGPGELFVWEFEAHTVGVSPISSVEVRLFDPDAFLIPDVTLPGTTVTVTSTIGVPPAGFSGGWLSLAPNPFNPGTSVTFAVSRAGQASVDVFDSSGRNLGTAWEGIAGSEPLSIRWDGRDSQGHSLPSGLYFFRLQGPGGTISTVKGSLLK